MNVFIDHQYLNIYDGEFITYVEEAIIKPLQHNHVVTISKNINETRNLLSINTYDLVILTGYSSEVLSMISVGKNTRIMTVVYDMTAEYILAEIGENEYLSDIVMHKSRLIFISHRIICINSTVKNQVLELYSSYKSQGVDISRKLEIVENVFVENNDNNEKKLIRGKYVVLKESVNGLTFVSQDFENIFNQLIKDDFPDITIIIVSNNFPQILYNEIKAKGLTNRIKIYKDVTQLELYSLYKYSICNIFASRFDNDINNLSNAISCNGLCLINEHNVVFKEFMCECGNYYLPENLDLLDIILEIIRTPKEFITSLKEQQKEKLSNNIKENKNTINKALANLF